MEGVMTRLACIIIAVCTLVGMVYPWWTINGLGVSQSSVSAIHIESRDQRLERYRHTIDGMIGKLKMSKVQELLGPPDRTGAVGGGDFSNFRFDGYWVYSSNPNSEYVVYYDPKNGTVSGTRISEFDPSQGSAHCAITQSECK